MELVVERWRLRVEGVVQGVGFRPHVYRLAQRFQLAGFVGNDPQGVFLEAEGPRAALSAFCDQLAHGPPAAVIRNVTREALPPLGEPGFRIVDSASGSAPSVLVSPDLDCCDACLAEVLDPSRRRYGYPFTNCTHCGPRYTLIEALPYDRQFTTMSRFAMCMDCRTEYDNPADRRFHAQPIACPACGPHLSRPVSEIVDALLDGEVLGIQGVGGYHLVCDATQKETVQRLRAGKGRLHKPFAVMVKDADEARRWAHLTDQEMSLMQESARPIVLARSLNELPRAVNGGLSTLGLMLPYTPFHHLLFADGRLRVLVMTSGNRSGLPIAAEARQAEEQMTEIADRMVHHNRPIAMACDDSVMTVFRGHPLPIRRSRGYAPFPIALPCPVRPALAVGAQRKSTFCLARGRDAFLSQHLGDLESLETLAYFEASVEHLKSLYRLEPEILCADLHPGYLSTAWAKKQGLPLYQVQHHHAHMAACMAEHGLPLGARALGVILDGTGYGPDGSVWGGEILLGDYGDFERKARLKPVPMAGGDQAVRQPWRMALSHLWAAGLEWDNELPCVQAAGPNIDLLRRQLERGLNSVPTSSMGRLFDAVAALLGVCQVAEYEAQAAILLEQVADTRVEDHYPFGAELDPAPCLDGLLRDRKRGVPISTLSARFHRSVAVALTEVVRKHHEGLPVVLSGGVFQNRLLLELVVEQLREKSVRVLTHRLVPPNDGGLSLGQVMVATAKGATGCV